MTALVWDEAGEKWYETGVDHGVLYVHGDPMVAIPWNGLVSVTDGRTNEVKSYYSDGQKYLDHQVLGAFKGKLQAFTYPSELDALTGLPEFEAGVILHDQAVSAFSMSYRTKVGNDLDSDAGYKINLLYNVLASPSDVVYTSIGSTVTPQVFEFGLTAVPSLAVGIRPTAHISLDSRTIDADLLSDLEDLIYGTVSTDPELPDLVTLLELVEEAYA